MNELLESLQSIFSAAFTTTFAEYFIGQRKVAPKSALPSLAVYPIGTERRHSGTVRDTVVHKIGVELTVNFQDYLDSTDGEGTSLKTLVALVELVEGVDSDGDLNTNTVMGILNANLSANAKVLYTDNMSVAYEEYLNPQKQPMCRVNVTLEAHTRPNRI